MSINVTVKGNPVSIKRGKMITSSTDYANDEFQKRRRMRLEQVRQQSKEIAEDVRNRVRKQKYKQVSQTEKRAEKELQEWKDCKLLELQQQYLHCLDNVGLANTEGDTEVDTTDRKHRYEQLRRERGKKAAERAQIHKNEKSLAKAIPVQQKKFSRDIEDTRAAMITNLNKKKKRRKKKLSADINISTIVSNSEEERTDLLNVSTDSGSTNSFTMQSSKRPRRTSSPSTVTEEVTQFTSKSEESRRESTRIDRNDPVPGTSASSDLIHQEIRLDTHGNEYYQQEQENAILSDIIQEGYSIKNKSSQENKENVFLIKNSEKPMPSTRISTELRMDTRISDRIKSRKINNVNGVSQPRPCHCEKPISRKPSKIHNECPPLFVKTSTESQYHKALQFPEKPEFCSHSSKDVPKHTKPSRYEEERVISTIFSDEIPSKPTVSLKGLQGTKPPRSDVNKVKYYHHATRFSKEYVADESQVRRIEEDSLEVCPSNRSEAHFTEMVFKRDREAEIRGKKAWEKEKAQRDYKEMMEKLPLLQRQERIASIGRDKPKFHMDEERLKQYELQRQNRMENAYENLFPKAPLITISPKSHVESESNGLPFKTIDAAEKTPIGNIGSWDVASHESRSATAVPEAEKCDDVDANIANRRQNLKRMLEKLKVHREQLAKEVGSLPKESNLYQLLNELGEIDILSSETQKKPLAAIIEEPIKQRETQKTQERIVFQNSSTQTTPCVEPKPTETSKVQQTKDEDKVLASKSSDKSTGSSQMCEILIKIGDKQSQLYVNSEKSEPQRCRTVDKATLTEIKDPIPKQKTKATQKTPPISAQRQKTVGTQKTPPETKHKSKSKTGSWRDCFTQNSTSSTSYMSPPEILSLPQADSTLVDTTSRPRSILIAKPKQGNLGSFSSSVLSETSKVTSAKIDPRLARSIKKLLKMSRASIEDLRVSSVSDVSTPGGSVVDTTENNPLTHLQNLMDYFNVNAKELQEYLSSESDKSFSVSLSDRSAEKSYETEEIDGRADKTTTADKSEPHLETYNELVQACTKRIENLSSLIDKVRLEKLRMLENPHEENSTAYYDLPSQINGSSSTSDSAFNQEEFNRKMLEIDFSLAEELKKQQQKQEDTRQEEAADDFDQELVRRFRQLLDFSKKPPQKDENAIQFALINQNIKETTERQPFVPLLVDIPQLPKFETLPMNELGTKNSRGKPPPSKGLISARRFNNGIMNPPHELSTIAEADSQLSSRLRGSKSPESRKSSQQPSPAKTEDVQDHSKSPLKKNSDAEVTLKNKTSDPSSETSTSELENMEPVLQSLRMAWGISTLKRTQEALALTSSSSSLDLTTKKAADAKASDSSNSSNISLKDFLKKELLLKLSASSSSDLSPYLREMQNLSAMHESTSKDKTTQRTSTPVLASKSGENSKNESQQINMFNEESELSSVRAFSDEQVATQQFVSLRSDESTTFYESRTKSD